MLKKEEQVKLATEDHSNVRRCWLQGTFELMIAKNVSQVNLPMQILSGLPARITVGKKPMKESLRSNYVITGKRLKLR